MMMGEVLLACVDHQAFFATSGQGLRGGGECADMWMCGCVDAWMCVWMCGCVDVWMCGCENENGENNEDGEDGENEDTEDTEDT